MTTTTGMTTATAPSVQETTDDRERGLRHYVAGLAEQMGLRDWTVVVGVDAAMDPERIAHAEITYGRRVLTITLGPPFMAASPEEQRSTAVHELLHAHLDAPWAVVRDVETQMGSWLFEMFHETYRRASEGATDAIAEIIAPHMPLPPT